MATKSGEIEAWGASAPPASNAVPAGDNFRMIAPGGHSQSLAIQTDGKLALWGNGAVPALKGNLLNDAFTDATVTPSLVIAIRADNQEIEIAGEFVHPTAGKGAAVVPAHLKAKRVMGVAAGGPYAVVIGLADQLIYPFGSGVPACPGGKFTRIRGRHGYTIGLDESGNLYGWGTPFGFPAPAAGVPELGPFPDFWESNPYFNDDVIAKKRAAYTEPSWRRDPAGHWFVPGPFIDLAAGVREFGATGSPHILALRPDGGVVGWGGTLKQAQAPNGVKFLSIAAGKGYSLGIANDGKVRDWGQAGWSPADPSVRYQSISAAVVHAAGVRGVFQRQFGTLTAAHANQGVTVQQP